MAMAELNIDQINNALASGRRYVLVRLLSAKGSTPRDAGALMLVGDKEVFGTIGGGSAEWVAVLTARKFIAGQTNVSHETITLGPEIDQCCGGVIDVSYEFLAPGNASGLSLEEQNRQLTDALIFGAGHTGFALARALSSLPFNITIIDPRSEYEDKVGDFEFQNLAMPEDAVRAASGNSVFVVTTHDHSLDFLITSEALARQDALYVGMIGSPTKRAVLKSWMGDNGYDKKFIKQLFCPIGGTKVRNKQPEVIAAMCVAEILETLEAGTEYPARVK